MTPSSGQSEVFDWAAYLSETGSTAAPPEAFCQSTQIPINEFIIGQKLEISSPDIDGVVHIATIVNFAGPRIRARFDGCDALNDLYLIVDSNAISPIGTRKKSWGPPLRYSKDISKYRANCDRAFAKLLPSAIAPPEAFKSPPPPVKKNLFQVGQKLEAVDPRDLWTIRPATIKKVDLNKVEIHLDGLDKSADFICSFNSRDLFPVGWCQRAGYWLTPPVGMQIKTGAGLKSGPGKVNGKLEPNVSPDASLASPKISAKTTTAKTTKKSSSPTREKSIKVSKSSPPSSTPAISKPPSSPPKSIGKPSSAAELFDNPLVIKTIPEMVKTSGRASVSPKTIKPVAIPVVGTKSPPSKVQNSSRISIVKPLVNGNHKGNNPPVLASKSSPDMKILHRDSSTSMNCSMNSVNSKQVQNKSPLISIPVKTVSTAIQTETNKAMKNSKSTTNLNSTPVVAIKRPKNSEPEFVAKKHKAPLNSQNPIDLLNRPDKSLDKKIDKSPSVGLNGRLPVSNSVSNSPKPNASPLMNGRNSPRNSVNSNGSVGNASMQNPTSVVVTDIEEWANSQVINFLQLDERFKSLGLAPALQQHKIDGKALLVLSVKTMKSDMGISLGRALKFRHFMDKIISNSK